MTAAKYCRSQSFDSCTRSQNTQPDCTKFNTHHQTKVQSTLTNSSTHRRFSHHQSESVPEKRTRKKKLSDTVAIKGILIRSVPVCYECFGARGLFAF